MSTKLIVGLGNPGIEYQKNRHNIGFMIVDWIADHFGVTNYKQKFSGFFAKTSFDGDDLIFLKPATYMNLSGKSVIAAKQFFKVELQNILVFHDELDLPFGKIKYKQGGGYAGHNGLKSIGGLLSNNGFDRLRFGIGRPNFGSPSDYVLSNFNSEEFVELEDIFEEIVKSFKNYIKRGVLDTMNRYNE